MALWVRWSGNGRGGTAVGMISCGPSLTFVSGHEVFHSFVKLSMTNEWAKDSFLLLSMSFDVELEVLN